MRRNPESGGDRVERALLALAAAASAAFVVAYCFAPRLTVDLWWTLAVGDYVRAHGDVPRTALWTVEAVRDAPYVCHGWLGAWALAAVADRFGLDAVPAVPTAIALAVLGCLAALARRLGASWLLALAAADLLLFTVLHRMAARSEVFAYLWFALALLVLADFARRRRAGTLAWLPALALLWVNSHGSFPLLPALLALFAGAWVADAWRARGFRRDALLPALRDPPWRALGASALGIGVALFAQPYGLDLVRSVLEPARSDSMTRYIVEWGPLPWSGVFLARFLVPAGLVAIAVAAGGRRLSLFALTLGLGLAAMAVAARRHLTLFGIGAGYALGEFAAGLAPGPRARRALAVGLAAAMVAATVGAAAVTGLTERSLARHPSPWVTPEGLAFLSERVAGNVLNSYHLGGLLIWFGQPRIAVSMDSRAAPYPPDYFESYMRALFGPVRSTRAFVERHAIDHVVLDRRDYQRHFARKLPALPEFRLAYQDERTVVLSRR